MHLSSKLTFWIGNLHATWQAADLRALRRFTVSATVRTVSARCPQNRGRTPRICMRHYAPIQHDITEWLRVRIRAFLQLSTVYIATATHACHICTQEQGIHEDRPPCGGRRDRAGQLHAPRPGSQPGHRPADRAVDHDCGRAARRRELGRQDLQHPAPPGPVQALDQGHAAGRHGIGSGHRGQADPHQRARRRLCEPGAGAGEPGRRQGRRHRRRHRARHGPGPA